MSQGDDMKGKQNAGTAPSATRRAGRREARVLEDELAEEARRERVTALRREVAEGRYRIDDDQLAAVLCDYIAGLNEAKRRR
jgi:anti-sigma28 factor (negative regulator of flagellin synthesis)